MLTLNDGRAELWQWDTGRTLAVDADCSQVHFSNKVFGRSIDVDVADGTAIIPDVLLQTDNDLNVWAFVGTAENGYTKISKTFTVNRRNKPADYVFTQTEQMTLQTIKRQIGDLADLTTEAKENLVAAINEAAASGGGGITKTEKNLMMTIFRAIPYLSDVHSAINSLESIWNNETQTTFSIVQNLTNCTSSNNASVITSGGSFSAEITANADYDMSSITVTMGGVDITASAVTGNAISIGPVSGNVVITAVASKAAYTRVKGITQAVNGAYIDTGYYIRPTDTVEFKFAMTSVQWAYIFQSHGSDVNYGFASRPDNVAGRTSFTRRNGGWSDKNPAVSVPSFAAQLNTTYHVVETVPGSASVYDESGNLLTVSTDENVSDVAQNGGKIFLFSRASRNESIPNTSRARAIILEEFIIHDNEGNKVHHYIPVLDENNVACLYDLVDKEYLYGGSGNDTIEAVTEGANA